MGALAQVEKREQKMKVYNRVPQKGPEPVVGAGGACSIESGCGIDTPPKDTSKDTSKDTGIPTMSELRSSIRPTIIRYLTKTEIKSLQVDEENPKRHPEHQSKSLIAAAAELEALADANAPAGTGFLSALQYNLMLDKFLDGHLRQRDIDELPPTDDGRYPVEFGAWNEQQHALAIMTKDPIAALAEPDPEMIAKIRERIDTDNVDIQELLQRLSDDAGTPWDGKPQEEIDEIKDYDPELETCSVRVNNVRVGDKELVLAIVEDSVGEIAEGLEYELKVEVV